MSFRFLVRSRTSDIDARITRWTQPHQQQHPVDYLCFYKPNSAILSLFITLCFEWCWKGVCVICALHTFNLPHSTSPRRERWYLCTCTCILISCKNMHQHHRHTQVKKCMCLPSPSTIIASFVCVRVLILYKLVSLIYLSWLPLCLHVCVHHTHTHPFSPISHEGSYNFLILSNVVPVTILNWLYIQCKH